MTRLQSTVTALVAARPLAHKLRASIALMALDQALTGADRKSIEKAVEQLVQALHPRLRLVKGRAAK